MAESDACYESPGDFLDKILDAAAHGNITQESALRLIFLVRKAGTKGYTWWKRIKLAEYWAVHKTTITRDYEQWVELGLVKLRPNPFKASAKLVIFPWSKVWDDAVWEDAKKVASVLPDLRESFQQQRRKGCTRATQKGSTDATFPAGSTITENLKDENGKQQQPSAEMHKQSATSEELPPKASGNPRRRGADAGSGLLPSGHRDEETLEGFAEMRALLARYHVGVRAGQIQALIETGRRQTLTLEGVFSFVEEKLKQKRDQSDPVFSTKLLIKAISDEADLHHFAVKRQGCSSFFEQKSTRCTAPFSVAELGDHLSTGAQQLRKAMGYTSIAGELDFLSADAEAQYEDLEALERHLTQLEREMIAIARSQQTEADAMQARQELEKELRPYREKMTKEQIAMLGSQFLERKLLESFNLPRLGLFYLGHQWGQAA